MDIYQKLYQIFPTEQTPYFAVQSTFKSIQNSIILESNDPIEEFDQILIQMFRGPSQLELNYYYVNNLLKECNLTNPTGVINSINKYLLMKIDAINEALESLSIGDITIDLYLQIWCDYQSFCRRIYFFLNKFDFHLTQKTIGSGKYKHDALSVIQTGLFYMKVFVPCDILFTQLIEKIPESKLKKLNSSDMDQLIRYVDSLRAFISIGNYIPVDTEVLFESIRKLFSHVDVINSFCHYLDSLIRSLSKPMDDVNGFFETKTIRTKINKIIGILTYYGDEVVVIPCYKKFMQARLCYLAHNDLKLEMELIKKISGKINKSIINEMVSMINDIHVSNKIARTIRSTKFEIKNEKYSDLQSSDLSRIHPILISEAKWLATNPKLEINYPPEISMYLDAVSRTFDSLQTNRANCMNCSNNSNNLNNPKKKLPVRQTFPKKKLSWCPTLGRAEFTTRLNSFDINIKCNILQSICLFELNKSPTLNIMNFSEKTGINLELCRHLVQTLFNADLIILDNNDTESMGSFANGDNFRINFHNYHGPTHLNLHKIFISTFDSEVTPSS